MQLQRDILTAEETLSIGQETLDKIIDMTFFDYKVGDQFFIKNHPKDRYMVLHDDYDKQEKDVVLTYGDGQKAFFNDVYPLFTTGMLIELLSFHFDFNLQTFGGKWVLIWNGTALIVQNEEDEHLVTFLWKALADIVQSDKYTW
ncbi:hypothetical protein P4H66_19505 [Paenibacillus dokdonensis]|uniref:Uncharacterized protein n=1 Tax=Paenibacillus dokdonensis TaxID=2567944 RepID=A0ABU6GRH7_9BACL|nr:hypothetical protein [Paenibacillus dokdonensis]MEC0241993.1 hypothetical protein [Paenibacillus dokdonensis]